jgi:heme-degrading monooxygenase HmoA
MVQVHVRARLLEVDKMQEIKKRFECNFLPIISRQEGFIDCLLLRDRDNSDHIELVIAFTSEELRMQWVRSSEHEGVWPLLSQLFEKIEVYRYDVVSK